MTVKGFGFFSEAFVNIIDSPKMNKKTKFCYTGKTSLFI